MTQNWWNAADSMGRIKIIIAEGVMNGPDQIHFDRCKNIVVFSFQHAPLG